jgi:hypothetical protein
MWRNGQQKWIDKMKLMGAVLQLFVVNTPENCRLICKLRTSFGAMVSETFQT